MSLSVIEELVRDLRVAPDRSELQTAFAIRDQLDVRIATTVAEFEAAGLHELDGAVSMTGWLRQEAGRDSKTAAKVCIGGRKLRAMPVLHEAVLDGVISGGQLDIILANIPARHLERFASQEAALIPCIAPLTVDQTRRAMEHWKRHADALDDGGPGPEHESELHLSQTLNGRGELHGSLDADTTAIVEAALRTAEQKDFEVSLAQRRAIALAQICQHFLDNQQTRTGGRHRPHLNVTISYEDLVAGIGGQYLDTDQPVSPATLGALMCDSAYHRLLFSSASGILDYGRATRAWPVDIYNAIALRDGGCRFGACDAPSSWCDIHHVIWVEEGGDTSVDNGLMSCRRHHHLVHRPGYTIKLLADGTAELTHPDGRIEISHPRGPVTQPFWRPRPGGS